MKIAGNHELAIRLSRALGLDPGKVASLELKVYPDEIVHADVKYLVEEQELEMICMELEHCDFIQKKK
jgi:hypothetical protein